MARYLLRRTGTALGVVVGATVVVFVVVLAMPGDPLLEFGGPEALSTEQKAALTERFELDEPLPQRYLHWLDRLLHGDLGESRASRRPVRDVIADALPVTLRLTFAAFLIEAVVGVGVGVVAATTRRPFVKVLVAATTTLAVTIPVFVVATTAQYFLGVRWGWLPISGTEDGIRSWILPATILALGSLAVVSRVTQSSLERSATSGYVELAIAKGVSPRRVMTHHRFRNALIPVVTILGVELATLAGGALFVEMVFNLPGMGFTTTRALTQHDAELVIGCALVLVAVFALASLVVDVMVAALDPRVRE